MDDGTWHEAIEWVAFKEWYTTELSEEKADMFKAYLRGLDIYFEASSAGNLIHFKCLMNHDEVHFANIFLDKIGSFEEE